MSNTRLPPVEVIGPTRFPSFTYQPFLFVTTNYDIIKNFIDSDLGFSKILDKIEDSPEILLSPRKNNKYFLNFDYNIGYTNSDIFTITITFIDENYDFENYFLRFLFNEEKYRKVLEQNYIKQQQDKYDQAFKQATKVRTDFAANLNLFNQEDTYFNIEKAISNKIETVIYFLFGINDVVSSPVAAQFRSADVTQNNDGFRKIKLIFQNLGHPYLLSELTKINLNYQSLKDLIDQNGYKKFIAYEHNEEINLVDLVEGRKFDYFIKLVLKKLFSSITNGREIITLLPDFDKLYDKFVETNSLDPRFKAFASKNIFFDTFNTQYLAKKSNLFKWYSAASFLRFLGFSVETDVFDKVHDKLKQIPQEVTEALNNFNNQISLIQNYLSNLNLKEEDIKILRQESSTSFLFQDVIKRNKLNQEQVIKNLADYNRIKFDYLQKLKEYLPQEVFPRNRPLGSGIGSNVRGVTNPTPYPSVEQNFADQILKDYAEALGVLPKNSSDQIDFLEIDNKIKFDTTPVKFIIIQKQDGTADVETVPSNKSFINFYKFLNEFSNNMSKIDQNFIFKVGAYEENDLKKLKDLANINTVDDYNPLLDISENGVPIPLVYDPTRPVIIIAEEWLMRNYYAPVTTTKTKTTLYPISDEDERLFGKNSFYYRTLIDNRKRVQKLSQSSFNENIESDQGANLLLKNIIKPRLDKTDDDLPYSLPVFISNDTNSNVLSYSLETDKLQHTSNYYQNISYQKKAINTELLSPLRKSVYSNFLNYSELVKYVEDYANKPNANIEELFKRIFSTLKNKQAYLKYDTQGTTNTTYEAQNFVNELFAKSNFKSEDLFYESLTNYLIDDILLELRSRNNTTTNFITATDIKFNKIISKLTFQKELYQKLFTVSIKTLPFFHINNIERLLSGAILIIRNLVMPGNLSNFDTNYEYNFLTGVYFINGFRHVIGQTSSYSEFILLKNPDVGGLE